jgi:radical SAM superfamily enzyme YgiQ (UPF0313 family)
VPEDRVREFQNVVSIQQPLGLAYIAAVLQEAKHEVKLIDAAALNLTDEQIINETAQFQPLLVGTPGYSRSLSVATKLKTRLGLPIVIGGPHVTALVNDTMKNKCFDYAILGEGEATFAKFAEATERQEDVSTVNGIIYKRGEEIVRTGPSPFIDNLDSLPFPARELLPPLSQYRPSPASCKRLPQATMMTSRGCPYHCAFCDRSVFGNHPRTRSPSNVVDEMEVLVDKYGAKEIRFWDDIFNINQHRVIGICKELLSRRLDVPWTCLARVDHMNAEVLDAMAKAGCWQVDYGIESGNQAVLDGIMKGQTLGLVERVVKMTRKAGIGVRGFFMLALPGETKSTMEDTISFAKRLDLTSAVFHLATPFPGTDLFALAKQSGELSNASYDTYTLGFSEEVPYIPKGLSAQDIKTIQHDAYWEFYFRPSFLMKRMFEIRSLIDVQRYWKAFFTVNGLS